MSCNAKTTAHAPWTDPARRAILVDAVGRHAPETLIVIVPLPLGGSALDNSRRTVSGLKHSVAGCVGERRSAARFVVQRNMGRTWPLGRRYPRIAE